MKDSFLDLTDKEKMFQKGIKSNTGAFGDCSMH